jgi:hypothetical protein
MGERNSQSEATETEQYLRAKDGSYGCEVPVHSNFAVKHNATGTAIFYNEDDDVSDLRDHNDPSKMFNGYNQYDWYCWVEDFEIVEKEPESEYGPMHNVVAFKEVSSYGIVNRAGEWEIQDDIIFVDNDSIIEDGRMWTSGTDEPLDKGLLYSELRFTTLAEARDWLAVE